LTEKQHKEFFIKYSLEKARETLKEIEVLLTNNLLNNAQSRLYYSIYYAVSALAYMEGHKTSKHVPLMGWFNKEFIHERQVFNPELFELYKNAYENRRKADYEFTYKAVREKIEKDLIDAVAFIDAIENYINSIQ